MFKKLFQIIIAGVLSVMILSPVSVFYSYDGSHRTNTSGATDVCWYPNQWKGTMSEGISFLRLDSNGFNNNYELENQEVNILLMGSSHMEALQVAPSENTGALLNELLPDYTTYNISIAGHTIYHCVDNLEAAMTEYAPTDYVIIETMDIALDNEQMQAAITHSRSRIKSSTGGSYYLARYIPGVNTILQKISNWRSSSEISTLAAEAAESAIADDANKSKTHEDNLREFLAYAHETVTANGCKLIILYHPTMELSSDGSLLFDTDAAFFDSFQEVCAEEDILFVDMSEDFLEMYQDEHILPNGFANTEIAAGHLNKYGHAAIAKKLAEIINADAKETNNYE